MSEQPLNFCTQAIESLMEDVHLYREKAPLTFSIHQHITSLLRKAVKFYLPDNGRLFNSGLRALPLVFRLPYPVTVAEFKITKDAPAEEQPLHSNGLHQSSKRIALAIEITQSNIDNYRWLIPQSKESLIGDDGVIAIIPVYYTDETKEWQFPPFAGLIASTQVIVSPEAIARTENLFDGEIPKSFTRLPIVLHPIDLMPEICSSLRARRGNDFAYASAMQDTQDELMAVLELIEILSCKNVTTKDVAPPIKLNAKRVSNKKTPFFEYKLLILDSVEESPATQLTGGGHASPRVHLRRGHIRRLTDKNIWVNSAVVGSKQAGVILKDYAVSSKN